MEMSRWGCQKVGMSKGEDRDVKKWEVEMSKCGRWRCQKVGMSKGGDVKRWRCQKGGRWRCQKVKMSRCGWTAADVQIGSVSKLSSSGKPQMRKNPHRLHS